MYDVITLKQDLTGILHGTTLNSVTNLNGVIRRAAEKVLSDVDLMESKVIYNLGTLNAGILSVACPEDLKGKKIIDIRPVTADRNGQIFVNNNNQSFDINKQFNSQPAFSIQFNSATKTILINADSIDDGTVFEMLYYSKFMFRDAITGAFQGTITDDSNELNVDTESYNILLAKTAIYTAQQVQGLNATQFDNAFWTQEYVDCLTKYKALYKSEYQKPRGSYYTPSNTNYNNWANARFIR